MKDLIIDETLIVSEGTIDGRRIITFTDDAKQCKQCQGIKNKKAFYKHYQFKDGLNVICGLCVKENALEKKLAKIRKEILATIDKIRPGVATSTMMKIKRVATHYNDMKVLTKLKKEVESIYFSQQVNDEMLNNIIDNEIRSI